MVEIFYYNFEFNLLIHTKSIIHRINLFLTKFQRFSVFKNDYISNYYFIVNYLSFFINLLY